MATQSNIPSKVPAPASSIPSNQLAGSAGQSGHAPGSNVKGFSGSGVIPGKI